MRVNPTTVIRHKCLLSGFMERSSRRDASFSAINLGHNQGVYNCHCVVQILIMLLSFFYVTDNYGS